MTSSEATDPAPIFVVGAPRSGTTLLRVLLNRHPEIGLCDETYYFYWVAERARIFGDLANAENRARVVDRYLETDRILRLDLDLAALRPVLLERGTSYPALFNALLEHYAAVQGKRRCGEKTPHHALVADQLLAWYPNCSIVHLVRDPRDVVSSLLSVPWGGRDVVSNAREWSRCVAAAHTLDGSPNYLLVRYEDLVANPADELGRVCAFIGESFSEDAVDSGDTDGAGEAQASERWWFDRAQGPVTTDRLGIWKRELSPRQAALVEWAVGEQMTEFGYAREMPAPAAPTVAAAVLRSNVNGVLSRLRRLPSVWYHWFQPSHLAQEEYWVDRR